MTKTAGKREYMCHCNKMYASWAALYKHKLTHSEVKRYECNICSKRFHLKKYLTQHLLSH